MGIQLDETDLSELEPQISKIFKSQLGFFDNSILTNTMNIIHRGVDRLGLEKKLSGMVEAKKAAKLTDEVFKIIILYNFQSSHHWLLSRCGALSRSSTS